MKNFMNLQLPGKRSSIESAAKLILPGILLIALSACGSSDYQSTNRPHTPDTNQTALGLASASATAAPTTTASISSPAYTPVYSPLAITLTCNDGSGDGCLETYYTIDGTTPNRASTVYTGPISIWSKTTLKYFSIDKAGNIEDVKTQNYLIGAIAAIQGIKSFAAGWNHTIGLMNDGTLRAWGGNGSGQLGDGTLIDRSTPVKVGADTNWSVVVAGNSFSLALKSNGTLWAWGKNNNGQLGINSTSDNPVPVQVMPGTTWTAIAAGSSFSLGIQSDGTLWAWGLNNKGQIGDGSTSNRAAPVQISADTTWTAIAAGYDHAVALRSNGTIFTWGGNSSGQLGNGIITNDPNPTPTQILGTNFSAIAAGGSGVPYSYFADGEKTHVGGHTIALKSDGTLWAWGQNIFGQLGDGNYNFYAGWAGAGTYPLTEYRSGTDRSLPFQIGTDSDWSLISAGCGHNVGLKKDGTLWAWGLNVNGQLANGIAGMDNLRPLPVGDDLHLPLILPKHPWVSIAAGGYHTVALRDDGTLWTWGWNGSGQLGDGTTISTGGGSNPTTMSNGTISPTWKLPKYAYVVSDRVYTYTVDYQPLATMVSSSIASTLTGTGTGRLASTGTPVAAGAKPTFSIIDPSGNFLYVTDSEIYTSPGGSVSYIHTFSINRNTGALTEVGNSAGVATLYSPKSIMVDPLGKFVYVIGTHVKGWQAIAVYMINPATGELTCNGTVSPGAAVMAIEPQGRFAYVGGRSINFGNHKGTVGLTGYHIDQTTGMLTSVMGMVDDDADVDDDNDDAEEFLGAVNYLTVDLSGQFLYVAKTGGSSISTYDEWGRPTTQGNPNSAEILVYFIDQTSGRITYTMSRTGETAVSNMAISPRTGEPYPYQYMYMLFDNQLNLLQLNQIKGELADWDRQPAASGAFSVVSEPTGKLVYVVTPTGVQGFAIDPWNGALQVIAGGPMAPDAAGAGRNLQSMVFASY